MAFEKDIIGFASSYEVLPTTHPHFTCLNNLGTSTPALYVSVQTRVLGEEEKEGGAT